MRAALCLALLAFAAPAFADDTIADQAQKAFQLYAGGLSQQDFLSAKYGNDLFRQCRRQLGAAERAGQQVGHRDLWRRHHQVLRQPRGVHFVVRRSVGPDADHQSGRLELQPDLYR